LLCFNINFFKNTHSLKSPGRSFNLLLLKSINQKIIKTIIKTKKSKIKKKNNNDKKKKKEKRERNRRRQKKRKEIN
jgi:hypothetical protein